MENYFHTKISGHDQKSGYRIFYIRTLGIEKPYTDSIPVLLQPAYHIKYYKQKKTTLGKKKSFLQLSIKEVDLVHLKYSIKKPSAIEGLQD